MPLGVRIERLWCPISDKGDGWRGYYWISPESQRKRWLRWVVEHPVRREEETSVMWVAHKLSLHEGSSPQRHIVPVGGQRSVGHKRCAPFNCDVACKREDQGSVWALFACLFPQWKLFCQVLLHQLLTETFTQSWVEQCDWPTRQPGEHFSL